MKKLIVSVVALVAVISGGLIIYNNSQSSDTNGTAQSVQEDKTQTAQEDGERDSEHTETAGLEISADGKTVAYAGIADETALETLKSLTEVETESTSFGEMVVGIHGLEADASSEYWSFYINGEAAQVGAGTYEAVEGDTFEWQLTGL